MVPVQIYMQLQLLLPVVIATAVGIACSCKLNLVDVPQLPNRHLVASTGTAVVDLHVHVNRTGIWCICCEVGIDMLTPKVLLAFTPYFGLKVSRLYPINTLWFLSPLVTFIISILW